MALSLDATLIGRTEQHLSPAADRNYFVVASCGYPVRRAEADHRDDGGNSAQCDHPQFRAALRGLYLRLGCLGPTEIRLHRYGPFHLLVCDRCRRLSSRCIAVRDGRRKHRDRLPDEGRDELLPQDPDPLSDRVRGELASLRSPRLPGRIGSVPRRSSRLSSGTYFLAYAYKTGTTYSIQKRTSADFSSWSAASVLFHRGAHNRQPAGQRLVV